MNKEKLILFILAAAQFTHVMDFIIIMPLSELLMDVLSINTQQFSFLVAAYTLSAGFSGFLGAFYLDKFDRRKVFLFFYVGFTIGTVACAIAPNYELLLGARIFTGMFGGVISSISLSIVGDLIPYERRAMALGIVMMAFSAASALGLPIGLYLAFSFGWNAPFWFLAILSGGLTFLVAKVIPPVRKHLDNPEERPDVMGFFRQLPKNKNQLKSLMFTVLLIFGQFTMIPFITPYLVNNVGFAREQIVFVYLIGGVVTIFSNPFVGKWADRKGKPHVFRIMAIVSIIPLILLTHLGEVGLFWGLAVTALFFLSISGRMVPAVAISTSVTKPQSRGSYMSIDSSLKNGAAGISSIVAGMIVVAPENGPLENYNYVGYLAVFFTLLAIFLVNRIKSEEVPKKQEPSIAPPEEELVALEV